MTRTLVALVALALALPAAAGAQTNAPPGNSAIDEYLETIPDAAGATRPRPPGPAGGDSALTPARRARLERLGPDGETLADAVDATAPARSSNRPQDEIAGIERDGRSPLSEVLATFSGRDDGSGMGVFLPVILLGTLLGAIMLVLLRRRAAS